jgi:hypothetical protein
MINMMLATTTNSTSVYFGMDHMCHKHNRLFTLDHIESCDALTGCQDIRKYANKLKDQHILDWDKEDRLHGIALFAYLTIQMQNLTASKEATLVSTQPATTYIRTGKKVGRPKKTEEVARTNSTINQFFAPAAAGASA